MSQRMKWRLPLLAVAVMLTLLLLSPVFCYAAPDIMPIDQVKAGMTGVGKTVVSGTKIEDFNVEVIGIMKNQSPTGGDLILVKVSGDLINRTGGIAQGMSGSPVYINGKLVGAIAYGWSFTDHRVGMITPIGDMLKLWDLQKQNTAATTVKKATSQPDKDKAEPLSTPLMASGFGEQSLNLLSQKLKKFNMTPYSVGGAPQGTSYGQLQPGSAVGVALIRGDVSLGALGTVTYVEGNKILAFGHPFLKRGNANYFMSNAYMFTTINGMENSFKLGSVGNLLGVINQDRGAGVAGEVNKYPNIIPMRVNVKDNSMGRQKDAALQIINDEQLSPVLAAVSMLNVMEKASDRIGEGTAQVNFEITARGVKDVIKRSNMYYSPSSIGEMSVQELNEAVDILANNRFRPADILDINVTVNVDDKRHTASIIDATPQKKQVKPGEKVDIAVKLQPYRGEPVTRTATIVVPKEQKPGLLNLEVRGGGMISVAQLLSKQQQQEDQKLDKELLKLDFKPKYNSLEDQVKAFTQRDRNNDLVIELIDMNAQEALNKDKDTAKNTNGKSGKDNPPRISEDSVQKKPTKPAIDRNKDKIDKRAEMNDRKTVVTTDYIIDGSTELAINVVGK